MSRARNIKPGFFRNADLVELPVETRLLFIGLWGLADREGRLADRPKQIKMEIYPADSFDIDVLLGQLHGAGFIERYAVNEINYIQIVNFAKHQNPHRDEKASTIPAPCKHCASTVQNGLNPESLLLNPESLNPESSQVRNEPAAAAPRDDSPPPDVGTVPKGSRAGELCLILRPLGVTATPGHPVVLAWADGLAVTDDEARETAARARIHKPLPQQIPMAYLGPILDTLRSEAMRTSGSGPPRGGKQAARDAYNASAVDAAQRLNLDKSGAPDGQPAERDITGESARVA